MADQDGFLTLQDIKTVKDVPRKILDIPEWGGKLEIEAMDVKKRMATIRQCSRPDGRGGTEIDQIKLQTSTIATCVIRPELPLDAIDWLTKKNAGVVERVFTEIYVLSGLLPEENETERTLAKIRDILAEDVEDSGLMQKIVDAVRAAMTAEKSGGPPDTSDFSKAPNEE